MASTGRLLLLVPTLCAAFNLDVHFPLVAEGPPESYFGYSVALVSETRTSSWLYCGAPKDNSSLKDYASVHEPGVLYRCNLKATQGDACKAMYLENTGNTPKNPEEKCSSSLIYCDKKDDAWIGGTLAVSPPQSDAPSKRKVATCGYRWVNQKSKKYYLMNGVCYWMWSDSPPEAEANKIVPLSSFGDQGYNPPSHEMAGDPGASRLLFYYAYGQAGFSAQFTPDGKQLVLGAPGIIEWKGSVLRYKDASDDFAGGDNKRRRRDTSIEPLSQLWVPNTYFNSEIQYSDYVGYSVASGRIISRTKTHFVTGAPRGSDLFGKILVVEYTNDEQGEAENTRLVVRATRRGGQLGEGFGASLAVVDVDGDGLDDILVGAPMHSLQSASGGGDHGKVYVYLSKGAGLLMETASLLGGQRLGARFGTSVSGVGDVNGDGIADVAVGAPYEDDGAGAVYLYIGSVAGGLKESQRLSASELSPLLRGFGVSVSGAEDIDGNTYPDLVVGAYDSGHAVVFRTKPVVVIDHILTSSAIRLPIDATGFDVEACVSYNGKGLPEMLDVEIRLQMDLLVLHPRVHTTVEGQESSDYKYKQQLRAREKSCRSFQIQIRQGNIDKVHPIVLELTSHLRQTTTPTLGPEPVWLRRRMGGDDGFCPQCPVTEPSMSEGVQRAIPFATGCDTDGDDVCNADLYVSGEFGQIPLVIGSRSSLPLTVTVGNRGENAFLAKVLVSIQPPLSFRRQPSSCQRSSATPSGQTQTWETLECDIGNPLGQDDAGTVELDLDVTRIPALLREVSVHLVSSSSSVEKPELLKDNNLTMTLPLKTAIDITISSAATPEVNLPKPPPEDAKDAASVPSQLVTVTQRFEVRNVEPTPIEQATMVFRFPIGFRINKEEIVFGELVGHQSFLDGQSIQCDGPFKSERGGSGDGDSSDLGDERRKRRDVRDDSWLQPILRDIPLNRTVLLNCTRSTDAVCADVTCQGGPLRKDSRAILTFRLRLNATVIRPILGKEKDLLILGTTGVSLVSLPVGVVQTGDSPDATVGFARVLAAPQRSLDSWIIWVSVAGGVLLLLLVVLALVKAGFFRRQQRDQLQLLKNEAQAEEEFGILEDEASTDVLTSGGDAAPGPDVPLKQ